MIGINCLLVFSLNYLCQSTEEMGISILKMGPLTFEVVSVLKHNNSQLAIVFAYALLEYHRTEYCV